MKVKHGVIARAEVERALAHLTQSKEKNPRLKKAAGTVLLPQPTLCPKRNVHLLTVVDGRLPWLYCDIVISDLIRRLFFHRGSETKVA